MHTFQVDGVYRFRKFGSVTIKVFEMSGRTKCNCTICYELPAEVEA